MTKRLVDIDDDLLQTAQDLFGAATMKETVNRALQEIIDLDRRRRLVERMTTAEGVDLSRLEEAWLH